MKPDYTEILDTIFAKESGRFLLEDVEYVKALLALAAFTQKVEFTPPMYEALGQFVERAQIELDAKPEEVLRQVQYYVENNPPNAYIISEIRRALALRSEVQAPGTRLPSLPVAKSSEIESGEIKNFADLNALATQLWGTSTDGIDQITPMDD